MPSLVFRLRNVPNDEADAVRSLMDENNIEWYETSAGNWGIAMPGIWVTNTDDMPKARTLIDSYQQDRATALRAHYEHQQNAGEVPTLMHRFKQHPMRTLGVFLFCLFIVYVSVNPFLQMIGYSKQG